jgi:FKBP-type peptidyl-prolyl cis-trans isomerase FkpA
MKMPLPLVAAIALALAACQRTVGNTEKQAASLTALTTERQRVSYMVGLDLSKNLGPIKDEVDIEVVLQALRDTHSGAKPLLDTSQADAIRQQFTQHLGEQRATKQLALAAKNRSEGEAFLAANARKSGIVSTTSGLQYEVLRDAKGARPKSTDTVQVNYIGQRLDGGKFEDTYAIDHPSSFALSQVFPGLAEALQIMPVGAKYRFWIPAALAYGENGLAGQIEPNSPLIFEIELMEIAGQSP